MLVQTFDLSSHCTVLSLQSQKRKAVKVGSLAGEQLGSDYVGGKLGFNELGFLFFWVVLMKVALKVLLKVMVVVLMVVVAVELMVMMLVVVVVELMPC